MGQTGQPNQKKKDKRGLKLNPAFIPDDVLSIIIDEKSAHEKLIKKSFSMERTIYKIIRDAHSAKLKLAI